MKKTAKRYGATHYNNALNPAENTVTACGADRGAGQTRATTAWSDVTCLRCLASCEAGRNERRRRLASSPQTAPAEIDKMQSSAAAAMRDAYALEQAAVVELSDAMRTETERETLRQIAAHAGAVISTLSAIRQKIKRISPSKT